MKDFAAPVQVSEATSDPKSLLFVQHGSSMDSQRKMALEYSNKPLEMGAKWYLINSDWYTRWLSYIGLQKSPQTDQLVDLSTSSAISPGRINNKSLIAEKNKLKHDLLETSDYFCVPEELWLYLAKCYNLANPGGQDELERFVIDDSVDYSGSLKIELHPLDVKLACSSKWRPTQQGTDYPIQQLELSRQTKLNDIVLKMRNMFEIPANRTIKLYFKSNDSLTPINLGLNETLNSTGYAINDIILIDVLNEEPDDWDEEPSTSKQNNNLNVSSLLTTQSTPPQAPPPPPPTTSTSSSSTIITTTRHPVSTRSSFADSSSYSNRHSDIRPGLCGLSNLGNTCFMNSAIQCMSNVPLLTDYFRDNRYKKEINLVNPLGRRGEIAESYADLINEMWSGSNSYTVPRNFKLNLSRFAPQFTGFQQQDSHELLAFLLDGLHEDLNRIIKKPYVELGSHVGKTDDQFAEESWQDHKKRNDSIIVDIFHGLLKSTLNCLKCQEISIKFDPFCYLSVPLPSKKERLIEIYYVPLDTQQPIVKYKLNVIKNGTISDLCQSLESLQLTESAQRVPKSHMMVCDVYTNKFFKIYEHSESIMSIRERDDIYIYELVSNFNNWNEFVRVKLHLRERSGSSGSSSSSGGSSSYIYNNSSFFGLPLYFLAPRANLTNTILYNLAFQHLKRFLAFSQQQQGIMLATSSNTNNNNNSGDEINSKLNTSLNVNDYNNENDDSGDDQQSQSQQSSQDQAIRTSQRIRNKIKQQSRLFNLMLCKNDNIDFENSHISLPMDDSMLFDSSSPISANNSNQVISLIADFCSNRKLYNKKVLDEIKEHSSCSQQSLSIAKKKDVISLADCFNLYTKVEELSEQDYWYCAKCKQHQPSTKKFDLWSLPPVLVVHLKRFSYSRLYRDKIDTLVDFPLNDLDMSSYLINGMSSKASTKYNLIAVSNHYGSLGGGHYTAYGKNRHDEKWYYFDDSSVSESDESNVCTNAAYLLVYLRQDMHYVYSAASNSNSNNSNNLNNKRKDGSQTENMVH